jgi:hypothetical protein
MSLEVAEHIPSTTTDTFLDLLIRLNKHGIILSWAKVGQAGHGHINAKNEDEVIEIMKKKGYVIDDWSKRFMEEGRKSAHLPWFHWSFFVFVKAV